MRLEIGRYFGKPFRVRTVVFDFFVKQLGRGAEGSAFQLQFFQRTVAEFFDIIRLCLTVFLIGKFILAAGNVDQRFHRLHALDV